MLLKITFKLKDNKRKIIFTEQTYKPDKNFYYTKAGKIARADIEKVEICQDHFTKGNGQDPNSQPKP